ncbi:hypothetical protein QL996_13450 [Planococcus sp. APC 4015]|nr:hypothetical protein [Planococcus sp. APC 4015]
MAALYSLEEDEEILWAGRPDPRKMLTGWDGFVVPLSIFWTVMGINIALNARGGPAVVSVVIVAAAGLFVMFGRFFVKAKLKQRTRYVLTSRRAFIEVPRRIATFTFDQPGVRVQILGRGAHRTLKFTSEDPRSYGRAGSEWIVNTGLDFFLVPGRDARFSFYDIPRTDDLDTTVENLINEKKMSEGIA